MLEAIFNYILNNYTMPIITDENGESIVFSDVFYYGIVVNPDFNLAKPYYVFNNLNMSGNQNVFCDSFGDTSVINFQIAIYTNKTGFSDKLAESLAEFLYNMRNNIITVDGSEYGVANMVDNGMITNAPEQMNTKQTVLNFTITLNKRS